MTLDETSVSKLRAVLESVRPDVVVRRFRWSLGPPEGKRALCKGKEPSALVLGYEIWSVLDPTLIEITDHLDAKLTLVKSYVPSLSRLITSPLHREWHRFVATSSSSTERTGRPPRLLWLSSRRTTAAW